MTRSEPALSVVVCSRPLESPDSAFSSVLDAGGSARERLELILVAEGGLGDAGASFDHVVDVYPAGSGYAGNRGLALASAPAIAFLDGATAVGPDWVDAALDRRADEVVLGPDGSAAFPREPLMQIGGFDLSLGLLPRAAFEADAVLRLLRAGTRVRTEARLALRRGPTAGPSFAAGAALGRVARRHRSVQFAARAVADAARDSRRRSVGEAMAMTAGVVVGGVRRPSREAPPLVPELVPAALRPELELRALQPLPLRRKAKTQLLYRAGDDALLHVHLDPSPRLLRALGARELIRKRSSAGGIPRLFATGAGLDSVWVLEEFLPGRRPEAGEVHSWFPHVADWAVALAHPQGPPLRESDAWTEHRAELLAELPFRLRDPLARAAGVVEALPAVHMHGDLQPANVLLSSGGVAAVDWEGAWLHGIPGLDLVFLALLARDSAPEAATLRQIAAGDRLRRELEGVGVSRDIVAEALLVHLASWSASERRRLARLGAPPRQPLFRPLLEEVGAELAEQASQARRRTTAGRPR